MMHRVTDWKGSKRYTDWGWGDDVRISPLACITNPDRVKIGNRVRIDPFAYISGEVEIGDNVQICAHAVLGGSAGIRLGNWTHVGFGSQLFSASEDYTGEYGPVNDTWGTNRVEREPIVFGDHSGVASMVMVFPGVTLPEGCKIGAQQVVKKRHQLSPWHTRIFRDRGGERWDRRNRYECLSAADDPAFLR